jgi:hypothetical protein
LRGRLGKTPCQIVSEIHRRSAPRSRPPALD